MHTRFSPDSLMKPEKMVSRCITTGLDCIAVTDHNTIDGALEVQRLASFRVIVGEEIKSQGGEIIGLFLKEAIPRGLPSLETVQRIKEQGGLVSIPHPFDHFRRSVIDKQALYEILPYVDIIEAFNARNTLQVDNRKALELALEHNILTSAVSDSHTPMEVGRTYVEIQDFDGTPSGLREALAKGNLVSRPITPLIHVLTTLTKARKRLTRLLNI
ncbi:MAG: PHP domain-containing protein [Chloroflexi bacterium]|nr:PHP domain-containing protein [Chloroflexota bacterium]